MIIGDSGSNDFNYGMRVMVGVGDSLTGDWPEDFDRIGTIKVA